MNSIDAIVQAEAELARVPIVKPDGTPVIVTTEELETESSEVAP